MAMRVPHAGQSAEVDHLVPLAEARQIGNEPANLELLPAALDRARSDEPSERQLDLAKRFQAGGPLSAKSMAIAQARLRPAGTEKYQWSER